MPRICQEPQIQETVETLLRRFGADCGLSMRQGPLNMSYDNVYRYYPDNG